MSARRSRQAPLPPDRGGAEPVTSPGRPPRWGLRTLGFLALAIVALGTSGVQGYHTPGTLACTLIGLVGAIYCSVRAVRALVNMQTRATRR